MKPDDPYSAFFLQPVSAQHRRYEALRARFVEGMRVRPIAERFGFSPLTVDSQIRDFKRVLDRGEAPGFFAERAGSGKTPLGSRPANSFAIMKSRVKPTCQEQSDFFRPSFSLRTMESFSFVVPPSGGRKQRNLNHGDSATREPFTQYKRWQDL